MTGILSMIFGWNSQWKNSQLCLLLPWQHKLLLSLKFVEQNVLYLKYIHVGCLVGIQAVMIKLKRTIEHFLKIGKY